MASENTTSAEVESMNTSADTETAAPRLAYFVPSIVSFIPEAWKNDGTYTADKWPADAVLLDQATTDEFWMKPAPEGKRLGVVDGLPAWVSIPDELPASREEIEAQRKQSYADHLTGSDRFFTKSQRMQAMGESGWEDVRDAGIARFKEIQLLYPWP